MARLAISTAAGAAGAHFGGGVGASIGLGIGNVLGNWILGPEGPEQQIEGLDPDQLRVQTSEYGEALPIVYGTDRLPGMVTWSSGIEEVDNPDFNQGGKGGEGPDASEAPFNYYGNWESTISEGCIDDVRRIWFDAKLWVDFSDTASSSTRFNSEQKEFDHFTYYMGSDTDVVDPTIVSYEGVGNVPAGRGKARIVFKDVLLDDWGKRIPSVRVELVNDLTVFLDWDLGVPPGTPVPNANWASIDVPTRHYQCTEPAVGTGFVHLSRNLEKSLGEYQNDTEYTYRAELRSDDRNGVINVRNADLDFGELKVDLSDGSELSFEAKTVGGLPSDFVDSYGIDNMGEGWYRLWMKFDTGSGSFDVIVTAGACRTLSPYDTQMTYIDGDQTEVRNPSFATTIGIPQQSAGLPFVCGNICSRVGYTSAQYDTSDLPDKDEDRGDVWGYTVGQQSARSALEHLQKTHFFDIVESQGKLKFVPRGGASVATIDVDDMVSDGDGSPLRITRGDKRKIPKRISVVYRQRDNLYERGEAHSQFVGWPNDAERNVKLREVLTDDHAARVADVMKNAALVELTRFTFSLPIEYYYLDPADVITITDGSNSYTVRMISMTLENLLVMRCEGVEENPDLYTSTYLGAGGPVDASVVGDPVTSNLFLMDLPMLNEAQNVPLLQFSIGGESADWLGARVYRSVDGGANYSAVGATARSAITGLATDALADAQTCTWDTTSTVNVALDDPDATLESRTDEAVLNGANGAALIKSSGDVEVFQFATATLEGDGTYTLSRLLRGRKGSESATSGHAINDKFVFLSDSSLLSFGVQASEISRSRKFKGVSIGTDIADITAQDYAYSGVNLKPRSPTYIRGSRDGSNNLTITWLRRSRFSAQTLKSPILGEDSESYEIDIVGASPARTITATSETASYTAAQQTNDGFTPGDPIEVNIYQISAIVGRGFAGNATI